MVADFAASREAVSPTERPFSAEKDDEKVPLLDETAQDIQISSKRKWKEKVSLPGSWRCHLS
jgi:hypothetical protein